MESGGAETTTETGVGVVRGALDLEMDDEVLVLDDEPLDGLEVEQINRNLFLFKFFSKRDRVAVLNNDKPWFFEKQLVVLRAITGDEVLSQVELKETPVWVQIIDIPLNHRTARNMTNIANRAGRFLCFDEKGEKGWGKFVWAQINLDVKKPLRKSLTIQKGQGHVLKECELWSEDSDEEEKTSFGEWLRASPRKPFSAKLVASSKLQTPGNPGTILIPKKLLLSADSSSADRGQDNKTDFSKPSKAANQASPSSLWVQCYPPVSKQGGKQHKP
ncbi:hypothetical protein Tsubulata_015724 [Turnera subulata]|uniref:DUF4283 domain-containing protein n=1 Tax=Turnera subulata TaxID=218843 RepID=A0A9Q0G361_9ROSI|nr:hypothetical protein Tsubulata_015724 [Turnera subulata]